MAIMWDRNNEVARLRSNKVATRALRAFAAFCCGGAELLRVIIGISSHSAGMDLASIRATTTRGSELLEHDNYLYRWDHHPSYLSARTGTANKYYVCYSNSCSGRLTCLLRRTDNSVESMKVTKDHICARLTSAEMLLKKASSGVTQLVMGGSKVREAHDAAAIALARHPEVSAHEAAQFPSLHDIRRKHNHRTNARLIMFTVLR